ncbi:hypothetical protein [Shouchella shacheensis]|uniref:hypothetical protein n=1 Tax=Shouchella shacheensis TaxID=1649580 RepID=UPI00073FF42D|nr:hypothetical protein [Shouchella shacheensis]
MKEEEENQQQLATRIEELNHSIGEKEQRRRKLEIDEASIEDKIRRLETHEIFQLESSLQESLQSKNELDREVDARQERLDAKLSKEWQLKRAIGETQTKVERTKAKLADEVEDLDRDADAAAFRDHSLNVSDYEANKDGEFPFERWKEEVAAHTAKLERALERLKEKDQLMARMEEKNHELAEASQSRDLLEAELEKWKALVEEEKQQLVSRIHEWFEEASAFKMPSDVLSAAARKVDSLFQQYDYDDLKEDFEPFVTAYQEQLMSERATVQSKRRGVLEEQQGYEEELARVEAQRDPEPPRHSATVESREGLNVLAAPFYELVEFKADVPDGVQKRLESALMEMGVLDALMTEAGLSVQHDRVLNAGSKAKAPLSAFLEVDDIRRRFRVNT